VNLSCRNCDAVRKKEAFRREGRGKKRKRQKGSQAAGGWGLELMCWLSVEGKKQTPKILSELRRKGVYSLSNQFQNMVVLKMRHDLTGEKLI